MYENCAGNYLIKRIPTGVSAKDHFASYTLDSTAASELAILASEDARRYLYNAVISLLGGIAGLDTQQAGWTVTKLYYCAFYVGRSSLCRTGLVIFHVPKPSGSGHTQYEIQASAGKQAAVVSKPPSTHKLVADRFQVLYPPFMRGLTIDGLDPLLWLMDQREYWQYRSARFPDPDSPQILIKFDVKKAQRLLEEYANDKTGLFLSDPDHALVSVPFRLVRWALSLDSLSSSSVIDTEHIAYLKKRCHIGKQTITAISNYLD
jgi:hypothetical protein